MSILPYSISSSAISLSTIHLAVDLDLYREASWMNEIAKEEL